jgi:hypothetical protein
MSGTLSQIPEARYDDLLAEARARLPALCPEWTDHGPADLGITLIELFAALVEMIRYRTRRETEAMTRAFLELLGGQDIAREPDLAAAMRLALAQVWTPYRAVTADDYEALTRDAWPASPEAAALAGKAGLRRVRCLAERDLEGGAPLALAPDHVTLVVLAEPGNSGVFAPLRRFFEPRRILTTRLHVVPPAVVVVRVDADLYLDDDVVPGAARARIVAALVKWFDPYAGGVDGDGWPFGGEVFLSDLYALFDGVPGVDFVADVGVRTPVADRALTTGDGAQVGLRLDPHEQVGLDLAGSKLRLFEPTHEGWKEVHG